MTTSSDPRRSTLAVLASPRCSLRCFAPAALADDVQDASQAAQGRTAPAGARARQQGARGQAEGRAGALPQGPDLRRAGQYQGRDRGLPAADAGLPRPARALQQSRRDLRLAGPVRQGARRARAVDPHASELRHRLREPGRRLRQAREPGLRQGAADRFGQRRREEQAGAGARAGRRPAPRRRSPPSQAGRRGRRRPPAQGAGQAAGGRRRGRAETRAAAAPKSRAEKPAAAKPAASGRGPRHRERLGESLVQQGRGCLPRLLRQGLQDPGRRGRARTGRRRAASASARPRASRSTVESPKVSVNGDDQASVTFRQGYRSDVLKAPAPPRRWCWRRPTGAG